MLYVKISYSVDLFPCVTGLYETNMVPNIAFQTKAFVFK